MYTRQLSHNVTFQDIKPNRNSTQRSANYTQGTMLIQNINFVGINTMPRQLSYNKPIHFEPISHVLITTVNTLDLCCQCGMFYFWKSDLNVKIELWCGRFCLRKTISIPQCLLGHRQNKRNNNSDFVNWTELAHFSYNDIYNVLCSRA